jgi:DNA-binding Lrp family transcriptional regulator
MMSANDLDRIDFEIVAALQNDARLSNKELAAKVGLAPSSCLERVRRLRARGVLQGFHAAVDPHALGIGLQALIAIRIQRHSRRRVDEFQAHALGLPEAIAVYHVAGANDFLIHVAVRDADHLRNLALDAFTTRPEVEHMETSLIFGYRQKHALPNFADVKA